MASSLASLLKPTKPLSFFLNLRRKSYLRWPTPYATLPPPVPLSPFYNPGSASLPSSPTDKFENPPPTNSDPVDSNWPMKSYLRWPTPFANLPPQVPLGPFHPGWDTVPSATTSPEPADSNSKHNPGSGSVPSSPTDKFENPPPTNSDPVDSNWPMKSYLPWPTPFSNLPPRVPLGPFHPGWDTVPSATASPEPVDSNSKPKPEPEDSNQT